MPDAPAAKTCSILNDKRLIIYYIKSNSTKKLSQWENYQCSVSSRLPSLWDRSPNTRSCRHSTRFSRWYTISSGYAILSGGCALAAVVFWLPSGARLSAVNAETGMRRYNNRSAVIIPYAPFSLADYFSDFQNKFKNRNRSFVLFVQISASGAGGQDFRE